ncbi:MAG: putative DNA binding domain-containing protein, partial [Anaerovoracaceae bacterium]
MDIKQIKELLLLGEKVNTECKEAKNSMPRSAYETYSAFANTDGGYIILGVEENKSTRRPEDRFIIRGVQQAEKTIEDFWNTINSKKVNVNILIDDDVYIVKDGDKKIIVIEVPRADYKLRPVYIGENPLKGTLKRNNEGDYHCSEDEVRAMIRDQNPDGNDGLVLEHYTMEDIDVETLIHYRKLFQNINPEHIWNSQSDKEFLESLGGYRIDRRKAKEGLTLAGLMMFGKGLAIRDEFDNIFMDYRDENNATMDIRWNDRVTYDGTWENNLFNFFAKVIPKLTSDLKKPFKLEGIQRIDDTAVHKAVREAFVNMIIHADYLLEGTIKVIKISNGFTFTNPGILKLPKEEIYKGGNSKPRNSRMQTMLRMVGYGDNAGSGFPSIVSTWAEEGWETPKLVEDTVLNQVTLT